jgi:hypothetical protein
VEAQLLASQRPVQQSVVVPPPPVSPTKMVPSSGPQVPQHVGQQQFFDDKSQYPAYPFQGQQFQHFPPQGQYIPPQTMQRQQSPQHSPVRQTYVPPTRPLSFTGSNPTPNFQEIMAAENQRLLAEDAKRRKRNHKLNEMVPLPLPLVTSRADSRPATTAS